MAKHESPLIGEQSEDLMVVYTGTYISLMFVTAKL